MFSSVDPTDFWSFSPASANTERHLLALPPGRGPNRSLPVTRPIHLVLALAALFCFVSCGDTHEKAAQDGFVVIKEFTDVLADIQDRESAERNKSKLEDSVEKMRELDARMQKLGELDSKRAKTIANLDGTKEVMLRFVQQTKVVSRDPEIMAVIQPIVQEMQRLSE